MITIKRKNYLPITNEIFVKQFTWNRPFQCSTHHPQQKTKPQQIPIKPKLNQITRFQSIIFLLEEKSIETNTYPNFRTRLL